MTDPSSLIDPKLLERARAIRDARGSRAHRQHLSVIEHEHGRSDHGGTDRVVDERQLTPRRREVLELVAAGLTNDEIATKLEITVETVKSHVQTVLAILDARSRAHAVAIALRTGELPTRPMDSDTKAETPATDERTEPCTRTWQTQS